MKVPGLLPLLAAQLFGDLSSPPLVSYATYLGGARGSGAQGLAVDSAGYAYVSGVAGSPDFPFTGPPLGPDPLSFPCGFVTKLNPMGTGIVWSVCLTVPSGGRIALDGSGSIYVLSYLGSTVTKLTPNGDKILYSTTISSSTARSMAVDPAGNVYLAGVAGAGLPATPGAYRTTCSGAACNEAFVSKLNKTGTVEYVTYMGYPGGANAIAVDSRGAAWITGSISSTQVSPTGFVAKLDAAGAKRLYATAFGGGRNLAGSRGLGVVVDSQDAAYVVGSGDMAPTTPGSLQPTWQRFGAPVGFVIKFASNGEIVYGTYVGRLQKWISSVAVDAEGRAYFGLFGYPDGGGFLCPGVPTQVMVLSPDGSKVVASARHFPSISGPIALDGKGGVYLAGASNTTVFLTTPGAFQTQYSGGVANAFVAKFDFTQPAAPELTCAVNAATLGVGVGSSFGFYDGAVAAGEIVTLFGHGFSPGPGLRVTFDGMPAPLLYSDAGQINTVVPFAVGLGGVPTFLSIQTGTQTIGPVKLPVVPAQPGLFTAGGQAAILNEDGSVNSSANPALRGSIISAFMTGVGMYKGGLVLPDDSLGPLQPPFPVPVLGVGATVNGESAQVLFAGQAPGLIAGAAQVNLRVPDNAQSGMARLVVYVGNYASPYGGTPYLAIR